MGDEIEKGDNLELQTLLSANEGGDGVGPKEVEDLSQGRRVCFD